MKRKYITTLLTIICVLLMLTACAAPATQEADGKMHVTDMLGRAVELNSQANKVVAIGPGALRLCTYLEGVALLVGIEQMDRDSATGKPYVMANPTFSSLPVIGAGGPNNAPDAEKLLSVAPDVIITTYAKDKATADNLQSKTGIPVIAISYGKVSTFDQELYASLQLLGTVMGKQQRAQEVIDFMEACRLDLEGRTKDITEKPSVYIGALGARGTHGIESTQGNYSLFNAINANNVVDEIESAGSVMIDKEMLLQWNPDIIFIDGGGLQMVLEDYRQNSQFYNALSSVQLGSVYSQLPYNFYTTNIGTAIGNAYYMGKVIYPDSFKDIDPIIKTDEIYQFLLGQELYSRMSADYGGFKQIILE